MWIFNGVEMTSELIPPNSFAFLYKITHIPSGRWYIGRKNVKKTTYRQVKGKKKKVMVESDWKDYYSSSPTLKKMVEEEGKDKFKREILIFCETAAQILYSEEMALFLTKAMFDDNCLNENIRSKIHKKWFTKCKDFHDKVYSSITSSSDHSSSS